MESVGIIQGQKSLNGENRKAITDLASLASQMQPNSNQFISKLEPESSLSDTITIAGQGSLQNSLLPDAPESAQAVTFQSDHSQENMILAPLRNLASPSTTHKASPANENQTPSFFPESSPTQFRLSDTYFKRRSLSVVALDTLAPTRHRSSTLVTSTAHSVPSSPSQHPKKDHSLPGDSLYAIMAFDEEIEQRIANFDATPLSIDFLKQYATWFDFHLNQRQTTIIEEAFKHLKETIKRYIAMFESVLEKDPFDAQTTSFIKSFAHMDASRCLHFSLKDPILKGLKNAIEAKKHDLPDHFVTAYLNPLYKLLIPSNHHERSQEFITMVTYSNKLYLACSSFLSLSLVLPLYEEPSLKSDAISIKKAMDGIRRATTILLRPNFKRCSIHDAMEKLEMISILFENYSQEEIATVDSVLKLESYRQEWLSLLTNRWNNKMRLLPSFYQLYLGSAPPSTADAMHENQVKDEGMEQSNNILAYFKTIFPHRIAPRSLSADNLEEIALVLLPLDPLFKRYLQSELQKLFPALAPYDGHPFLYELSKSILPAFERLKTCKNFLKRAIERVNDERTEYKTWQYSLPHLDEMVKDAHWLHDLCSKPTINQFLSRENHEKFNLMPSDSTEQSVTLEPIGVTISRFLQEIRRMYRDTIKMSAEKKATLLQLFAQLDRLFPEDFTFGNELDAILENQCEMFTLDGLDEIGKLNSLTSRLPGCLRIFEASRTFSGLHLKQIIGRISFSFSLLVDKLKHDLISFEPASLVMDGSTLLEILAAMDSLIRIDGCKTSTRQFAGLHFLAREARNHLQNAVGSLKTHFENVLKQMNRMLQVHSFKDAFFLKLKMSRLLPFLQVDGSGLFHSTALLLRGKIPTQSQYDEACIGAIRKLFSEVHFKLKYPKTPKTIYEELASTQFTYEGMPVQDWYLLLLTRRELYCRFWATQFDPTFRVMKISNYDPTVPLIEQLAFHSEPIGIGLPTFVESSKGVWFLREPLWATAPVLIDSPSVAEFGHLPYALSLHQAIITFPTLAPDLIKVQSQIRLSDRSTFPDALCRLLSCNPQFGTGSAEVALKHYPSPDLWPKRSIEFLDSFELHPTWVPIRRPSSLEKWVTEFIYMCCALFMLTKSLASAKIERLYRSWKD